MRRRVVLTGTGVVSPLGAERAGGWENPEMPGWLARFAAYAVRALADRVRLWWTINEPMIPAALGYVKGVHPPCVRDLARPDRVLSAGERHVLALLCIPRTLLRYRRQRDRPYRVSGVMGCALLVTRPCFEAAGGFDEQIQVYYEDVDFCLGARAHGFGIVIVPDAVVLHDGLRGFASGLTPWAAYLKARNPWLLLRRHGGPLQHLGRRGAEQLTGRRARSGAARARAPLRARHRPAGTPPPRHALRDRRLPAARARLGAGGEL